MSEEEASELRRELDGAKRALAYLASCQAAACEVANRRKSTPKSERTRLQFIAITAAALCQGDYSSTRNHRPTDTVLKAAEERCIAAANDTRRGH
jgi:hypothetical protein